MVHFAADYLLVRWLTQFSPNCPLSTKQLTDYFVINFYFSCRLNFGTWYLLFFLVLILLNLTFSFLCKLPAKYPQGSWNPGKILDNILYIIIEQIWVSVVLAPPDKWTWCNPLLTCWRTAKESKSTSEPISKFATLPVIRAKSIFSRKSGCLVEENRICCWEGSMSRRERSCLFLQSWSPVQRSIQISSKGWQLGEQVLGHYSLSVRPLKNNCVWKDKPVMVPS